MTVQQLFNLTIGMMGMDSSNATTYEGPFIPQLNVILAQTFMLENNVRTKKALDLLTAYPTMDGMTNDLTYQDELLLRVVPWGVAQLMSLTDDDYVKAGFYGARFADEYNRASQLIATVVTDYYGSNEE
jgi:hypothetical protein